MNNKNSRKPNIVFILSDDQGAWALGCAGNKEIRTPNLDRLASTGIRFDNFFCTSPVCSPARASLLTGKIPSQHGIQDWIRSGDTIAKYEPERDGILIEYLKEHTGYTDVLAANGYKCGISGKWHLGDSHHVQKGFDFWYVHAKGGSSYYNAPVVNGDEVIEEPEYYSDVITEKAIEWLESSKTEKAPFYLSLHFTAPHSPWGRDNHPKEIFDRYYKECPFDSVPKNEKYPDWVKHRTIPTNDDTDHRQMLSGYYTAVEVMDSNIGKVLDWLEKNNLMENTLVIFTSDNGMNMGHHGVYGKGNATYPLNMFEESVKVPFIISHPGIIKEGIICESLVSQYDFMPTLLDYVGLENNNAENLPGKSFANILKGDPAENHDHVVVYDEYGPVRMVRTKDWKYIHRYIHGPNEFYDLKNDPAEQNNLCGNPDYADMENDMKNRLDKWFETYVDPSKDASKEIVTGYGQLGVSGENADTENPFYFNNAIADVIEKLNDNKNS